METVYIIAGNRFSDVKLKFFRHKYSNNEPTEMRIDKISFHSNVNHEFTISEV